MFKSTQAYIKLGKYKEAISDCEWALKVRPGWELGSVSRCSKGNAVFEKVDKDE